MRLEVRIGGDAEQAFVVVGHLRREGDDALRAVAVAVDRLAGVRDGGVVEVPDELGGRPRAERTTAELDGGVGHEAVRQRRDVHRQRLHC